MAKWFDQAREIERLRTENKRLLAQIVALKERLGNDANDVDPYGVSEAERALVAHGKKVEAIKAYRVRTGADLLTAKQAIDSIDG